MCNARWRTQVHRTATVLPPGLEMRCGIPTIGSNSPSEHLLYRPRIALNLGGFIAATNFGRADDNATTSDEGSAHRCLSSQTHFIAA